MPNVIVTYKVKSDAGDVNHGLVDEVFAELAETQPEGLRYMTFRHDDGVTFQHIALIDADPNPLESSAAFKEFQRELGDRCEIPPSVQPVSLVGAHNFLGSVAAGGDPDREAALDASFGAMANSPDWEERVMGSRFDRSDPSS